MESASSCIQDEHPRNPDEDNAEKPKFVLAPATLLFKRKPMTLMASESTPNAKLSQASRSLNLTTLPIENSSVSSDTECPSMTTKKLKLSHSQDKSFDNDQDFSSSKEHKNSSTAPTNELKASEMPSGVSHSLSNPVIPSSRGNIVLDKPLMFPLLSSTSNLLGTNGSMLSSNDFVFGHNLQERIEFQDGQEIPSSGTLTKSPVPLTFQEAKLGASEDFSKNQVKSVSESAREVESRQVKRMFEEVPVITGEEGECNILQMNCKLYVFGTLKSGRSDWIEKACGVLRLNDTSVKGSATQSRIIVRASGNLRVILNAKVMSNMRIKQPSSKTVQFSAVDNEGSNLYLVLTQPNSAEELYDALERRIEMQKLLEDL